ncbi:MAG: type I-B CRISPR-associated protein Cas8b1/Cst1 [Dictyoglomus sp. NZ13-RE01]|nr:MAG: type I-B CRISPR-associated protein Cas8b1/Cst1 [Dictyoglomus sp. NZ13-RE01]
MERVYLSDWLFNAGIIGFLSILLEGKEDIKEGENILSNGKTIYIGENYIQFERDILEGFSDKYFNSAYERYRRTDRFIEYCMEILEKINNKEISEKDIEKIYKDFKKRLDSFSRLKNLLEKDLPSFSLEEIKRNPELFSDYILKILDIIEKNKQTLIENDVKIYLGNIYGQKNFLNRSVTSDYKIKFKEEFEDNIIKGINKLEKNTLCVNCGERYAKKNINFDTGLSPFTGVNTDALNFFWNFKAKLPLCEICELIYFCTFKGFTESVREDKYFFVNSDTSVVDLYKNNLLLQDQLKKNLDENIFIDFFSELLINEERQKSKHALQSIAFIEIDLTNKELLPKVFSFNISRSKAEFLKHHSENTFKIISKISYSIKDKNKSIVLELLEKILANTLNYDYLNFLEYLYLENLKGNMEIKTFYYPYHLNILNLIISEYLRKFRKRERSDRMSLINEDQIWFMFKKGEEIANKLIEEKAENKIPSLSYKLLSYLRTEDIHGFMDHILRIYISYALEVPTLFVKAISDKELFLSYGYSFVNGILSKYTSKE